MKISKLTKAQEKKVPVYLSKWMKTGLRTKTIDKKKARAAVNFFYEDILKMDKPKYVIFLDSPMACELACNLIKGTKFETKNLNPQLDSQLYSQLYSQLRSQLRSQLDSQLRSQLRSQLDSQLYSQLDSQLRSQLDSQLDSQLRSQLYSQLDSQLRSQLRSQLDSQLRSQLYSQKLEFFSPTNEVNTLYWAGYYGFYDYLLNVLMPEKKKEFKVFNQITSHLQELHYTWMFKDLVLVSDFPKGIKRNEQGQLHNPQGAAIEYRDTWALYYLNGIKVTKEIAEAKTFTKSEIVNQENADVGREIIRKIGIEKAVEILEPQILDTLETQTGGKYELLAIQYDKRSPRPYLKMKCSSSKETFILGVRPEIKTAQAALNFLNNVQPNQTLNIKWEA